MQYTQNTFCHTKKAINNFAQRVNARIRLLIYWQTKNQNIINRLNRIKGKESLRTISTKKGGNIIFYHVLYIILLFAINLEPIV